MTREEIENEFREKGFKINGDLFVIEKTFIDNNYIINGVPQKRRMILEMKYIGEGWIKDVGDSEPNKTVFHEFDILGEKGEPVTTLCVENFDDFVKFVGW